MGARAHHGPDDMDVMRAVQRFRPAWLDFRKTNGRDSARSAVKAAGSGVDFVGSPDSSRILWVPSGQAMPDADRLTRAIAFATSAYCYRAIEYRATTLAEPPLGVWQDGEDGMEEVSPHPLDVLLTEPSPDYDMGDLVALTEAYRLITGEALWVKARSGDRGTGPVDRLIPYSGDEFETEAADGRIYGRFRVTTANGTKTYLPDEVVYFRELSPSSWREPTSKLDVALAQFDLGHQVNRTIRNFMRKAMFAGGVVSPDKDWNPSPDEWKSYQDAVRLYHTGPAQAGEPLILLGGTTFSATTLRLRDILPSEVLDRVEATTSSVFGIPPIVLGWLVGLQNSPWSQMSEARRMGYEDTIEPRWRDTEKRMTRQLLPPTERAAWRQIRFDTRGVRALQDDDAERAKVAVSLREEWTLNERRTYTGKDPLDDERGDEIGGGGGGGGIFDVGGGAGGEMARDRIPGLKAASTERGLVWALFDANTKAAESSWARVVAAALDAQKAEILKLARKHLDDEKAVGAEGAETFQRKVDQWLAGAGLEDFLAYVYPLVFSTAKQGVKQVAAKLGLSFGLLEEGLQKYSEREATFLASVMGETTGRAVAAAVQAGLDEGETIRGMIKRLEELPAFDRARARLTARTETTRAWNGAQRSSLSDYQASSGQQIEKGWLSARDDRVREEHEALDDGTWIPIDGTFPNGLTEPGEPNCRCTLIYRLAEASAEGG